MNEILLQEGYIETCTLLENGSSLATGQYNGEYGILYTLWLEGILKPGMCTKCFLGNWGFKVGYIQELVRFHEKKDLEA